MISSPVRHHPVDEIIRTFGRQPVAGREYAPQFWGELLQPFYSTMVREDVVVGYQHNLGVQREDVPLVLHAFEEEPVPGPVVCIP